jgi:hypothetical protein
MKSVIGNSLVCLDCCSILCDCSHLLQRIHEREDLYVTSLRLAMLGNYEV